MRVTSIVPLCEVCDLLGPNVASRLNTDAASCSTVFKTEITTTCSMVLTYAFTKSTITDCAQNITFSTQSSYSLVTATAGAAVTPALLNHLPSVTTYVQSIVSYYVAPWQALAANTPSNVTVLVCEYEVSGNRTCEIIQEIWEVHTKDVPVITTSAVKVLLSLASVRLTPHFTSTATDFLARRAAFWSNSKHHGACRSIICLYRDCSHVNDPKYHDFDIDNCGDIDYSFDSDNHDHLASENCHDNFEFCNSYSGTVSLASCGDI